MKAEGAGLSSRGVGRGRRGGAAMVTYSEGSRSVRGDSGAIVARTRERARDLAQLFRAGSLTYEIATG